MNDKMLEPVHEPRATNHVSRVTGEQGAKIIQLIVFNLGDEEFSADIDQVSEIKRIGTVTPIPDSPAFIKGVTNIRGDIVLVIDLKARFFLRPKKEVESQHIVITGQDKNLFGLMVDEVTEVLRIPETEIKPTPDLVTRIDRVYISGVVTIEDRLIILLDLTRVLSEQDLIKLSEIQLRQRTEEEQSPETATAKDAKNATAKSAKRSKARKKK